MRIAICNAYGQEFYADAPKDINVGDIAYVQYAKDKRAAAEVLAVGEYEDDAVVKILLKDKPKKQIIGKIIRVGGE